MTNSHYFIAVPLESEYQEWLAEWQNELKQNETVSYKSWTHKQDLHITLKFLGPVTEPLIQELTQSLQKLASLSQFEITLGKIGFFGKARQPRVLWTGVEKNNQLNELQKRVEEICLAAGFGAENRPYRPHITLAKKWKGDTSLSLDVKEKFTEERIMTVNHFVVYKIHPSQNPKYEQISKVKLK